PQGRPGGRADAVRGAGAAGRTRAAAVRGAGPGAHGGAAGAAAGRDPAGRAGLAAVAGALREGGFDADLRGWTRMKRSRPGSRHGAAGWLVAGMGRGRNGAFGRGVAVVHLRLKCLPVGATTMAGPPDGRMTRLSDVHGIDPGGGPPAGARGARR